MIRNQKGQMFILATIVLTLLLINTVLIVGNAMTFSQVSDYSVKTLEAEYLTEAGLDKAVASLNKTGGIYSGESKVALGSGEYSITVTDKNPTTKIIKSEAAIPSFDNPKVKKSVQIEISRGSGVAFNYGMQVGEGGVSLGGGATINGSLYSNGNISMGNGAKITGDVYIAGGVQPTPNQESDCVSPNCSDFIFGKSVGGNMQLNPAQSFKPSVSGLLNKISLKVKKFGSPPNLTVRLLGDNSGKPNKNVIAQGTLYANFVTSSYGFIEVSFNSAPTLTANTTYWIVIDACNSSGVDCSGGVNYWSWSLDSAQGYNGGVMKWSPNWNATPLVWNSANGDLGFKTYMGGVPTTFNMGGGSKVNGNVHVNTITGGNGVVIDGNAYYQSLDTSITVNGTKYPNSPDPAPAVFPVSNANIADWKAQAEAAGVTSGNVTGTNGCHLNLGPGKIVGNVTLGGGCHVTVKSPLWITGTFNSGNGLSVQLDSSAGSSSGIILVDGFVRFGGGGDLLGSGSTGSYLMMLTTYNSKTNGVAAIDTGNGSVTGILYAPDGIVDLGGGANFKEVTAWKITMGNGATLNYESGIASLFFSSGPSGSFSVIKGTYQEK